MFGQGTFGQSYVAFSIHFLFYNIKNSFLFSDNMLSSSLQIETKHIALSFTYSGV